MFLVPIHFPHDFMGALCLEGCFVASLTRGLTQMVDWTALVNHEEFHY